MHAKFCRKRTISSLDVIPFNRQMYYIFWLAPVWHVTSAYKAGQLGWSLPIIFSKAYNCIYKYIFINFFIFQIAFESLQFILPNKKLMGKNFEVSLSLGGTDPPFSFFILLHVGLWVVIFICDRVLQYQHHQSQAKGYLEFFRETKELRRIPHAILSLGLVTFSQHYQ